MKEVEAVIQPIVAKAYQQAGAAGGMPGGFLGATPSGWSSEKKGLSVGEDGSLFLAAWSLLGSHCFLPQRKVSSLPQHCVLTESVLT